MANEGTTVANEGTTVAIKGTEIKAKVRVFFRNEKLTRNQISESEGLCVIIIRRSYKWLHECPRIVCYPQASRWFVKDWDDEEELLTAVRSLSTTDYINDPYHKYLGDVLEYIHALREYTGEGGICPAKPPIAEDLPKGLNEIGCSPSPTPVFNDYSRDLMDDTCPVCYEYFKDENERRRCTTRTGVKQ